MVQETTEDKPVGMTTRKKATIEIAGAAIFIGLSAVVSAVTTMYIPRIPGWGMAVFDPISLVWITCFCIFGWRAGLLCTGAGTLILFAFDPTGIGPFFKFFATIPFLLLPMIGYLIQQKRGKEKTELKKWLSGKPAYATTMACAWGVRIPLMLLCNYIAFVFIFPPYYLTGASLAVFGLPSVKMWDAIIAMTFIVNTWQSFFDTLIPYLLSFKLVPRYMTIL